MCASGVVVVIIGTGTCHSVTAAIGNWQLMDGTHQPTVVGEHRFAEMPQAAEQNRKPMHHHQQCQLDSKMLCHLIVK